MIWLQLSMPNIILILGLVLLWCLYKTYIRPYRCLIKLGLKVPFPKPLIGNLFDCKPDFQHTIQLRRQEKYGYTYGTLFFTVPTIWIADPEILKLVLVKEFSNFTNHYGITNTLEPFDKMLIELRDTDWKRVRNVLLPTFSSSKLKFIMPLIDDAGNHMIDSLLNAETEGKSIDLRTTCGKFTMEVILATAFGIELETSQQEKKLINATTELSRTSLNPLHILLLFSTKLFSIVEPMLGGKFMKSIDYLSQTCKSVIKQRRRNMAEGIACRRDILQLMIEAGDNDKLDDSEIIAQALIFLVGGYETTANTLSFATYLLATNPKVQQRLHHEISTTINQSSSLNYDSISELPYLDMVISETLRIYPPAFKVNREAKEDILCNGLHIIKDAMIVIPIYGIHHNPKFWPNPEEFIPERFTPDNKCKQIPCTYLPFGTGPRNCIGMRLALLEVKLALVKILQHVELVVIMFVVVGVNLN